MPDTMYDKKLLRSRLLAHRQGFPAEVRRAWDKALCGHLLACWQAHPADTMGVYWPIREEPDLRDAYAELAMRGVQLALPVVIGRSEALRFAPWSPGDPLRAAAFGVPVPETHAIIQPELLLLPCVGVNPQGYRLGYGGGFYDRTLERQPRPRTIGVAYACCVADFAADPHDIPLDQVITERGVR